MKAALIIANVQNDYFENGALPIKDASEILSTINSIRTTYDKKFVSIFLTQITRPETHIAFIDSPYAKEENLPFDPITIASKGKFKKHCVKGTQGANLSPEMLVKGNEILIRTGEDKFKEEMSGFCNPQMEELLKANGINTVFIGGLCLDFFVGLTAIDSASKGFDTYIVKDMVKSVAEPSEKEMMKNLELNKVKMISYTEFEEMIKKIEDIKQEEDEKIDEAPKEEAK